MKEEIELLGKLNGWKQKTIKARDLILRALDVPGKWSVSFSGGKDSTVLLDMVLKEAPDISIIWFDDGWDYPETHEFLKKTEERIGRKIIHVNSPLTAKFWKTEMTYGGDDPAYPHESDIEYQDWARQFNGSFMGLRREESVQRHFTLAKSSLYYCASFKHWHCSPLANWKWEDIWGYIGGMDIEYNQVYPKLYDMGITLEKSRVGPLTAWMIYQWGSLATIKRGWPDLYNRFMKAFPEARSYT